MSFAGIIGCGNVTEVKSGPALQRADGSALVAVMRRDATKAADYAARHGVPRWYADADQLIDDPDVDAVYVATPPGSHAHYALRVLDRRKPCYVEKPMARNAAECLHMVDAFAAQEVPLFVAYYRRGLPRFQQVKTLLATERLGRISSINVRYSSGQWRNAAADPWRLNAELSGGGYFLDLASHTLDVLDYLFGPLRDVSGVASNVASCCAVEDNVAMIFRAGDDILGSASWNFAAGVHEDIIEITGTEGRISLSTFGNDPVMLTVGETVEEFSRPNPPHIQQPLIQTMVDDLLGKGQCHSTGRSAARTNRVMDEVLKTYYGGREDAFWTRSWPGTPVGSDQLLLRSTLP